MFGFCGACVRRYTITHFERNPFQLVNTSLEHRDFANESTWRMGFCQLGNFFFFSNEASDEHSLEWGRDWPTANGCKFRIVRVLRSPSSESSSKGKGSAANDNTTGTVVSLLGATISFAPSTSKSGGGGDGGRGGRPDAQLHRLHVPTNEAARAAVALTDPSQLWLELPPIHQAPVDSVDRNPLHRMWRRLALDRYTSKMYVQVWSPCNCGVATSSGSSLHVPCVYPQNL